MRLLLLLLIILMIFLSTGCNLGRRGVSPLSSSLEFHVQKCSPMSASYGAVTGRLFLTNYQPAIGSILYLGEYVGLETSNPVVVLDPAKHLHTQTDEKGAFCFPEVPPGSYGLIVWDAAESVLLSDPNTGRPLLLEIKPGEAIDVGVLYSPIP